MQQNKTFYITTTLPYVNAVPHMGHALEFVRADTIARYRALVGYDVFFNTGTDEHGQKMFDAAARAGLSPIEFADRNAEAFKTVLPQLGISESVHFIRTTDPHHMAAAQELWRRVRDNGYIYKSRYQAKYCVGCELEKTDSDLVDGRCPDHPNLELQEVDEENYFFKFSAFQEPLLQLYRERPDFVTPDFRLNEVRSFVQSGLHDFSVSRLKSKMSWGVPVPDDDDHVMYVWFDALTNYISTLGWPENQANFEKYWVQGTPIQYCGQDNLRQQSAMWQAMLMAAGLPTTHRIFINGFVMGAGGVKMSKTIGNVVDPMELVAKYGTEAVRYYVSRHIHPFDGSPMSLQSFHDFYTASLVNGLGNLVSRLMTLAEKYLPHCPELPIQSIPDDWVTAFEQYRPDIACEIIWRWIGDLDRDISETEPFKQAKVDLPAAQKLLSEYVVRLYTIARMLSPILPDSSEKIMTFIRHNKKPVSPLFPRVEL